MLGDGDEFGGRFGRDSRLGLSGGRSMRLLEESTSARSALGSDFLRFGSLGGGNRRRAHVGAPLAKRRLGFGWCGGSESGLGVGDRLDRRLDGSIDRWRGLDSNRLLIVLGISSCRKRCEWTCLVRGRAKLLHKFIDSHNGSRRWRVARDSKLLAWTIDFDVTSRVVVLALDSPVGADIGLASVLSSDLTGSERRPRDDARQR